MHRCGEKARDGAAHETGGEGGRRSSRPSRRLLRVVQEHREIVGEDRTASRKYMYLSGRDPYTIAQTARLPPENGRMSLHNTKRHLRESETTTTKTIADRYVHRVPSLHDIRNMVTYFFTWEKTEHTPVGYLLVNMKYHCTFYRTR